MASRRRKSAARSVVALGIALGCHVVGLVLLAVYGGLDGGPAGRTSASRSMAGAHGRSAGADDPPIQIETLVDDLSRTDQPTAEEQRRQEEAKKEEESKEPRGQVVDLARPAIEQRPERARFAAEYDSKVDREIRGPKGRDKAGDRAGDTSAEPAAPAQQGGAGGAAAAPEAAPGAPGRPGAPGPLAMRAPRSKAGGASESTQTEDEEGGLERSGQGAERPASSAGRGGELGSGTTSPPRAPGDGRPNLVATPEMLQRAIGHGGGSMDYLKDLDEGEATALNAKKWKHAPFFNRVKRSVANEWHPDVVYVRHDPTGNVYGVKDRVTVLRVRLDPGGKLAGWTVLQSSGVDFLDDEAIDAFRRAGPFPNPPRDLIEADGKIHFNFAFIFELSGRTQMKVFKYQ